MRSLLKIRYKRSTWSQPPNISSITILDSLHPFQLCYNMLTMAPIAQPYSHDACRIGYGAFSALGWAESRFGFDFLVVYFSNAIVSIIIIFLKAPMSFLLRHHLYCRANTCLIAPLLHSGWLSLYLLSSLLSLSP